MKTLKILVAIATISMVGIQQTQAQEDKLPSAESILKKYVDATGGLEKYKSIKNMVASGTLSIPQQNINGTIEIAMVFPDKLKVEADIPGMGSETNGCDGNHCWNNSIAMGPRLLVGEEADALKEETSLARVFDPASFYKSMETVGIEDVEGEECYKVVLTKKNDKKVESYYSIESGLELKSVQSQLTAMGAVKIESYSSDYRDNDGLMSAFKVEQKLPGGVSQIISMDKVEYNTEIEDSVFAVPDEIQQLVDKAAAKKEKAGAGADK